MKLKQVLGTVTIIAIAGGTIYAIKKSKDAKKAEEQEITLDEAKEIVKEKQFEEAYAEKFEDKIHFTAGPINVDGVPTSFELHDVEELEEDEEEYFDEDIEGPSIDEDEDDNDIGEFTEEDRKLRHEPSSLDALKQYKRMELAELVHNGDVYQTMLRLYDFPFQPTSDGDDLLRTQIIDYRVQFFGFGSRWAQQVTFADVINHYARNAQFNCDETVGYWVEYFLDFNDLYYAYSGNTMDETIRTLNNHTYFNEERQTFGLFGLTRNSMDSAIKTASRNIDSSVTYEIEFQEFLKSCF